MEPHRKLEHCRWDPFWFAARKWRCAGRPSRVLYRATGTWTNTGPFPAVREGTTATLLGTGNVLLTGFRLECRGCGFRPSNAAWPNGLTGHPMYFKRLTQDIGLPEQRSKEEILRAWHTRFAYSE